MRLHKSSRMYRGFILGWCCVFMMFAPLGAAEKENATPAGQKNDVVAPNPGNGATSQNPENDAVAPDSAPLDHAVSPSPKPGARKAMKEVRDSLLAVNFTYTPDRLNDPFVSFIAPAKVAQPRSLQPGAEGEDDGGPPTPQKPLTPLQQMNLGEIESGLKAILWGEMGRRAIIEDNTGRGYIVTVGTLLGDNNGVIAEIFEDRLVIRQETWDGKLRRMVPQNIMVKLAKKEKK